MELHVDAPNFSKKQKKTNKQTQQKRENEGEKRIQAQRIRKVSLKSEWQIFCSWRTCGKLTSCTVLIAQTLSGPPNRVQHLTRLSWSETTKCLTCSSSIRWASASSRKTETRSLTEISWTLPLFLAAERHKTKHSTDSHSKPEKIEQQLL